LARGWKLRKWTKEEIIHILNTSPTNRKAAETLGVTEFAIHRWIKRNNLKCFYSEAEAVGAK
jgi:IS30 family transposase